MEHELLTKEDLLSLLRNRGIEGYVEAKGAYIEGDGTLSVISYRHDETQPVKPKQRLIF